MPADLSTGRVWDEIARQNFAVLAFVTPKGEARTAGIVYIVEGRQLYIGTDRNSWKTRHIEANPNVSVTVTVPKSIPLVPWVKIPPATITFQGKADILLLDQVDKAIVQRLFRGLELASGMMERVCLVRVEPVGEFLTYGIGVSLQTMRKPGLARGRAPV